MAAPNALLLEPRELIFRDVRFHQPQQATLRVQSDLRAPVDVEVRPGSSDRYSVTPAAFRLRPGEAMELTVALRLGENFAARARATEHGQRDAFIIRTPFFDQRFHAVFFLAADPHARGPSPLRSPRAAAGQLQHQPRSPQRQLQKTGAGAAESGRAGGGRQLRAKSPQRQTQPAHGRDTDFATCTPGGIGSISDATARMRKSVSFAELPSWRSPGGSEGVGGALIGSSKGGRQVQVSAAAAAGKAVDVLQDARCTGGAVTLAHGPGLATSAVGAEPGSKGGALHSWRASLHAAQQQQQQQQQQLSADAQVHMMPLPAQDPAFNSISTGSGAKHRSGSLPLVDPVQSSAERSYGCNDDSHADNGRSPALALQQNAVVQHDADSAAVASDNVEVLLRQEIARLEAALTASQQLAKELAASHPQAAALAEAGAAREQALQEARNRRALQLLLQKDETIKKLTAQLASAEGRAVEQRDAHTRELMAVRESYATQLAALEHQLEEQSRQLAAARAEALSLAAQLEACAPVPLARSSGAGSLQAEVSLDAGVAGASREGSPATADHDGVAVGGQERPDLLSDLAQRDARLAALEAELAVARAALAGAAELPGEAGATAQVVLLQRELAQAHAQLAASTERLAELQATQALAEAAAEEGELMAAARQRDAGAAAREASRAAGEAQLARMTAARLNARVSELAGALADAQSAAAHLQQQLDAQAELHSRECKALQRKLTALLAAGGPELAQVAADCGVMEEQHAGVVQVGAVPVPPSSRGSAKASSQQGQQAFLSAALEDAEAAVALLQARLAEADQAAVAHDARLSELQDRASCAAVRHAQQLAAARAAGSAQLGALQDAVARLGQRGKAEEQAAALSLELAEAQRRCAQLAGELEVARQEATDAAAQQEDARRALLAARRDAAHVAALSTYPLMRAARLLGSPPASAAGTMTDAAVTAAPHGRHQPGGRSGSPGRGLARCAATGSDGVTEPDASAAWAAELARGQALLASLAERAQRAELALAADRFGGQQGLGGRSQGTTAIVPISSPGLTLPPVSSSKHHSPRSPAAGRGTLEQQLEAARADAAAVRAELNAARQQAALADVQLSKLEAQAEAARAAAADALGRVRAVEVDAAARIEAALAEKQQAATAAACELSAAVQRAADADAARDAAFTERDAAAAAAAAARQAAASWRGDAARAAADAASVRQAADATAAEARRAAAAKDREVARLMGELDAAGVQAGVLLETLETLQAGGDSEREQRIVALTAQAAAAAARTASQEARVRELLDECEARGAAAAQLRAALEAAQQDGAARAAAAVVAEEAAAAAGRRAEELRAQVKASSQQVASSGRALAQLQQRVTSAEAEVAGMRTALEDAHERHAAQLREERTSAIADAQRSLAAALAREPPTSFTSHTGRITAALDELLAAARSSAARATAATTAAAQRSGRGRAPSADVSWVVGALARLKELLTASDRLIVRAGLDAALHANEASCLAEQLGVARAAAERAGSRWRAAEASKQILARCLASRTEQAAGHSAERLALQASRIETLWTRCCKLEEQLAEAHSASAAAAASGTAARNAATAAAAQLERARTDADAARATAAAAVAEAAGAAEWARGHASALAASAAGSDEPACAVRDAACEAVRSRDAALMSWLESRLLQSNSRSAPAACGGTGTDEAALGLARQVCGLKLVEAQLQASLAAADARADAALLRAQRLAAALDAAATAAEEKSSGCAGSGDSAALRGANAADAPAQLAALSAVISAREQELHEAKEQLLQTRQLLEARELEAAELQAHADQVAATAAAQQTSDAAALTAQRAALGAAASAEAARLRRELQELRTLLDHRGAEAASALAAEREQAASNADEAAAAATSAAHAAASDALHASEVRSALLEGQLEALEAERDALQKQAAKLAADLAEARDAAETRGSAVAALEAALAAVERGEARQCAGMPATRGRARTPPRQRADVGTEPGADAAAQVDGADVDGDSTAAVAPASVPSAPISRELVKAQLANADLQRKLRVSARAEVELRSRLAEREARLQTLKQQLQPSATVKGVLPRDHRTGVRGTTASASTQQQQQQQSLRNANSLPAAGASAAAAQPGERDYLAHQVAALRISLARRDADVQRLQAELADAVASQREPQAAAQLPHNSRHRPTPPVLASTHSATEAARLARAASERQAMATLGHSGGDMSQTLSDAARDGAASASALATARAVLEQLYALAPPGSIAATPPDTLALGLEEALAEVVYAAHAILQSSSSSSRGGEHDGAVKETPAAVAAVAAAEQLATAAAGLEAAAAERGELAARLEAAVAARDAQAKQLAATVAERDSLAAHNAALAAALGDRLASGAAGGATQLPADTDRTDTSAAPAGAPNPSQLRELGLLMQRLTRDNAALMRARDAALSERHKLADQLSAADGRGASLMSRVEAGDRQVLELRLAVEAARADAAALSAVIRESDVALCALKDQLAAMRLERDGLAAANAQLAACCASSASNTPGIADATRSRDIAALLQRLTHDNAALIRARDAAMDSAAAERTAAAQSAAEASRAAAVAEEARAAAAAGASARCEAAAATDAAAAARAEMDRMQQTVSMLAAERAGLAAQVATLASAASELLAADGGGGGGGPGNSVHAGHPGQSVSVSSGASAAAPSPQQLAALLPRLAADNALLLRARDDADAARAGLERELGRVRSQLSGATGSAGLPPTGQQQQGGAGTVSLGVEELRSLQAAAAGGAARAAKWKARCRALAERLGGGGVTPAPAKQLAGQSDVHEQESVAQQQVNKHHHQQQQQHAPAFAAQQLAKQLAEVLKRAEKAEAGAVARLTGAASAAGALLGRGEELAGAAASAGERLELQLAVLLAAARRAAAGPINAMATAAIEQEQQQQQAGVFAGAAALQAQLVELTQQLEATGEAYAVEAARLRSSEATARADAESARAAAGDAEARLRSALCDHAAELAGVRSELQAAQAAGGPAALADALEGRAAAEAAVQSLAARLERYRAGKQAELEALEGQLAALLEAAPPSVIAEWRAARAQRRSSHRMRAMATTADEGDGENDISQQHSSTGESSSSSGGRCRRGASSALAGLTAASRRRRWVPAAAHAAAVAGIRSLPRRVSSSGIAARISRGGPHSKRSLHAPAAAAEAAAHCWDHHHQQQQQHDDAKRAASSPCGRDQVAALLQHRDAPLLQDQRRMTSVGPPAPADIAAQLVAGAAARDALESARRAARFECLARRRAEAGAEALRSALTRCRARLRSAVAEAGELRAAAMAGAVAALDAAAARDEAARASNESSAARDAARAARADLARRSRAVAAAVSAATAALGGGKGSGRGGELAALLSAGMASCGAGERDAAGPELAALPGLLAALTRELTAARTARDTAEGRLREARIALDRRGELLRDARARADAAAAEAAHHPQVAEALEARVTAAEARARSLASRLNGKEAALRDVRAALDQARAAAAAAAADAASATQHLRQQQQGSGQERPVRTVSAGARRACALQRHHDDRAVTEWAAAATAGADDGAQQQDAADGVARLAAAAALLPNVSAAARRLVCMLRSMLEAMMAAAGTLEGGPGAAASPKQQQQQPQPVAAELAELVALSSEELADLLGPGDEATALLLLGPGRCCNSVGAAVSGRQDIGCGAAQLLTALESRLAELEAAVAPAATEPGARSGCVTSRTATPSLCCSGDTAATSSGAGGDNNNSSSSSNSSSAGCSSGSSRVAVAGAMSGAQHQLEQLLQDLDREAAATQQRLDIAVSAACRV